VNVRPDQAKRLVLVSLIGLLGLAAYRGNVSGDVGLAKRLWGVGALGVFLTVAADVAPGLAGPFALLVLIGYATDPGDKATQALLDKISGSSPGVAVTPAPTPPGVRAPAPAHPGPNK
jgi:hypothetical protein